jgi:integrase
MLLEANVPIEIISAVLGHSGISITADVYAKVRSDLKRRGLAKLDGG